MKWKPPQLNSIDFSVGQPILNVLEEGDRLFPLMTSDNAVFDFLAPGKDEDIKTGQVLECVRDPNSSDGCHILVNYLN